MSHPVNSLSAGALTALFVAGAAQAGAPAGNWYFSPQALYVIPQSTNDMDSAAGLRLAVGKTINEKWDGELAYSRTRHDAVSSTGSTDLNVVELDAKRVFRRDAYVSPYIALGLGLEDSRKRGVFGSDNSSLTGKLGGGFLVGPLKSLQLPTELVAEMGMRQDTPKSGGSLDMYFAFGVRFFLGHTAPAAIAPVAAPSAPVAVAPTPPAPATDADADGVLDNLDRCPDTASGAKVDANGCELDGDRDGVVDRLDRCPTTPSGDKVDAVGCSMTMTLQVTFDTNSANIKPDSFDELDRFVVFLRDVPSARGELQGHTDDVGKDSYNLQLSQRRADAVKAYVVSKGIDAGRIAAMGYGETQPAVDNNTAAGRAQNRRVQFVRGTAN